MPERVKVQGDLFHGKIPVVDDGQPAIYVGRQFPGQKRSDFANPFRPGALFAEPDKPMRVPPLPYERYFGRLGEGRTLVRLVGAERWVYTVGRVGEAAHATALFIAWAERVRFGSGLTFREQVRRDLDGKTLACWCPEDSPYCHASCALLPWAAGYRASTPDIRIGTKTTVKVKRCCNGCGEPIGDVTEEELFSDPLPDVRSECPRCAPLLAVAGD
ncbi:MAG TPA: DUF4326 domain-containing protein [Trebonia sp.]